MYIERKKEIAVNYSRVVDGSIYLFLTPAVEVQLLSRSRLPSVS